MCGLFFLFFHFTVCFYEHIYIYIYIWIWGSFISSIHTFSWSNNAVAPAVVKSTNLNFVCLFFRYRHHHRRRLFYLFIRSCKWNYIYIHKHAHKRVQTSYALLSPYVFKSIYEMYNSMYRHRFCIQFITFLCPMYAYFQIFWILLTRLNWTFDLEAIAIANNNILFHR